MVHKRPFGDEDLYEVSSKQPRHVEPNSQLMSGLDLFPHESVAMKPYASGGDEGNNRKQDSDTIDETLSFPDQEIDTCIDGSASNSSWPTSSTTEEDTRFEVPFDTLKSPEYYPPYRTVSQPREDYFSLLSNPPQKLVPIGPDFQAELPEWGEHGSRDKTILDEKKLAGTCIIPMPNAELPTDNEEIAGVGRVECSCSDAGSMSCVRQHILEAREKHKTSLGEETFVRLGFLGMGDVVTEKWCEEEEDIFHEVVFSNPASLGKDFWKRLAIEFPSRTKKELVSYYFNVFILRKRAKQNRFDPSNIDSDNDEWQEIDDTADDEGKVTDGDEDSVVESPEYEIGLGRNEIYEDVRQAYGGVTTREAYKPVGFGSRKVFTDLSAEWPAKLFDANSIPKPNIQSLDKGLHSNEAGYYGVSSAPKVHGVAPEAPLAKTGRNWASDFGISNDVGHHDFMLGPCSAKEWDFGYLSFAKNEFDLLPTCTMMEEIFGDGAWSYKSRDSKGLN